VEISCTSTRAYLVHAVIIRPAFFDVNFFNWWGRSVCKLHFIKTYLIDNSNRDRSESPGKFLVGHRNDGSWEWKSLGSTIPLSVHINSRKHLIVTTRLSPALRRGLCFTHSNCTHPTLNCREGVWCQKIISSHHEHLHYGKMAAISVRQCIQEVTPT